jgi:hypothetical protein
MNKTGLIVVTCILCTVCMKLSGQDPDAVKTDKKEARNKFKLEKELLKQKQFDSLYSLISARSFVFEAEFVSQDGGPWRVRRELSFVKLDSNKVIIQLGPAIGFADNGFGGVTSEGQITKFNISRNDKQRSCGLSVSCQSGVYGSFDLVFLIFSEGISSVRIVQAHGSPFRLDGYISGLHNARVQEGFSRQ